MRKKILFRSFFGLLAGIALGQIIIIVISIIKGNGDIVVVPELVRDWGNELYATIFQTSSMGMLGATLGAISIIWDIEKWNLLTQTVLHFILFAIPFHVVALSLHWIPQTIKGIAVSIAVFVVIYILLWSFNYFQLKLKISKINKKLLLRED